MSESDPNAARHSGLKRPPSKTIQRPKNQCRVIITLEVEVSKAGLESLPRWKKDATDYMRQYFRDTTPSLGEAIMDILSFDPNITVLSFKDESDK